MFFFTVSSPIIALIHKGLNTATPQSILARVYDDFADPEIEFLLKALVDFSPSALIPNKSRLLNQLSLLIPFCSKLNTYLRLAYGSLEKERRIDILYELASNQLDVFDLKEETEKDIHIKYLQAAFKMANHFKDIDSEKYDEILLKVFERFKGINAYAEAEVVARRITKKSLRDPCIMAIIKYLRRKLRSLF